MRSSSRLYCRPPPIPKMPPGLMELMDGLARDVLRHNPSNVYEFCASHMAKLLEIRDGPSVKKSLTLEQKILRAQEKMRKKAQDRRKKFDSEMKLLSNNDNIPTPVPVISEDLVPGPSFRGPVHHEVDLKNSSEVEISHVSQVEKAPLELTKSINLDGSNTEEIIVENLQNMDNPAEAEILSDEIISIESTDSEIETEKSKKIDEPIFGKIETEVMNVEPMKESKQEILDVATIDSPLQTITEGYEENCVNDSSVILPIITIGNDGCDTNSVSDISWEVENLQLVDNTINKVAHEHSIDESSAVHQDFEYNQSNDLIDNNTRNEPLLLKPPTPEIDENKTDFVPNCGMDSGYDSASSKNEKQTYKEMKISEITHGNSDPNLSILLHQDPDVNDSPDGNLLNENLKAQVLIENSNVYVKEVSPDSIENEGKSAKELNIGSTDMSAEKTDNSKAEPDGQRGNIIIENKADIIAETDDQHKNIATGNNVHFESEVCGQDENTNMENKNIKLETSSKTEADVQHENVIAEIKADGIVEENGSHKNINTKINAGTKGEEDSLHKKMSTENESVIDEISTENKADIKTKALSQPENNITGNKVDSTAGNEQINEIPKNEAKLDTEAIDENVNLTELQNTDIKSIDTIKIEPEIINHPIQADKENLTDDYENHLNNTDISLQKSQSTENTNGDNMSTIESDLSKTDDDSAHNNSDMDLETAAVTIQKVFRSFMFKSRNSTFEDNANDEHYSVDDDNDKKEEYYAAANINKERRPLGITRMDTVLQTVNEEKSLSLSTDDSSTLSSAATTIQAHVRGFLVRNRLNSSKTFSMNSLVNSHEVLEADEQHKNKTILNIHIVPEKGNYLSRDESLITSMELSLDGSPPSSVNLHPFSFDISERRKMLKREDAIQSVSPPSNNSGKLSEDSVKEMLINENGIIEKEPTDDKTAEVDDSKDVIEATDAVSPASSVTPITVITISKSDDPLKSPRGINEATLLRNRSLTKLVSDEADVITPYESPRSSEDTKLIHSGEFHDVVLPTKVLRNDTSAVRGE